MSESEIPLIDIAPLFKASNPARAEVDSAILAAASRSGFMTVTGLPEPSITGESGRRALLKIFAISEAEKRKLWRQKFAPGNANVYRGWFPKQKATVTCKEGIDLGPDIAYGAAIVDAGDPLREATPLPSEKALPGFRASASAYYRLMETIAAALMRSIARALELPENAFDGPFRGGISTLRLIRYPLRSEKQLAAVKEPGFKVRHKGRTLYVSGKAHCDSGFVTLLAQDGVQGLQARSTDGAWIDVPPHEGTLAVNFGRLLERWTDGRIKATEHRVVGYGEQRCSIPFFYEPRADARIAPLPIDGIAPFTPFLYGDHLWEATTKFVEFAGMEGLRPPRGPGHAASDRGGAND